MTLKGQPIHHAIYLLLFFLLKWNILSAFDFSLRAKQRFWQKSSEHKLFLETGWRGHRYKVFLKLYVAFKHILLFQENFNQQIAWIPGCSVFKLISFVSPCACQHQSGCFPTEYHDSQFLLIALIDLNITTYCRLFLLVCCCVLTNH